MRAVPFQTKDCRYTSACKSRKSPGNPWGYSRERTFFAKFARWGRLPFIRAWTRLESCVCKMREMKIGKDTMVTLEYTLRYDGPQGEIIERYTEDDPMEILVGHGLLLDVLETNLQGMEAGEGFDFLIGEEQGYGPYDEEKVVQFPESDLLAEVPENENIELKPGDVIVLGNRRFEFSE